MFKNDYRDSFGKTYTSNVYESAQKTNKWSLAYTLGYALSKNGMRYATEQTGKCSVIKETSLAPTCALAGTTTSDTVQVDAKFKSMTLTIRIATSSDGKYAFPDGIFVIGSDGTTLGTLCKYDKTSTTKTLTNDTIPLYGPKCSWMCNWSNDANSDEGKYSVQTATFKDASGTFDCCSLHFWAEDIFLGAVMFFKSKDYFSTRYKYGFGMFKATGATVFKFADGSDYSMHPIFEDAGVFPTKIAKACFFTGSSFAGLIGGINGIYQLTDGYTVLSAYPENKVIINGREFQAVAPGLFARTS